MLLRVHPPTPGKHRHSPGGRGPGESRRVLTEHNPALHPSPPAALCLLEKRLARGGRSLGPLVREMSGGPDIILVLLLLTILFRNRACSTLGTVTRGLWGPFRRWAPGRRFAAAAGRYRRGRSLRQWLRSPSRCEKDGRPSIFIEVSHNPPPPILLSASG